MRRSYRSHGGNREYWRRRWDRIEADTGSLNLDRYPGRHAESVLEYDRPSGPTLEAGCGLGRVLLHWHRAGRDIVGIDFIESALGKIRQSDAGVRVAAASIEQLPFPDATFPSVLAFGLYHNLEQGIRSALKETRRVLKPGGILCASMRADNIQNRVIDWLSDRAGPPGPKAFHKINYTRRELKRLFRQSGFEIVKVECVENMSFLYKIPLLRHRSQRRFDERSARGVGYRLSPLGAFLQRMLMAVYPEGFCNIFVLTARAAGQGE